MSMSAYRHSLSAATPVQAAAEGTLAAQAAPWLARHRALPLPGRGLTLERWRVLAAIAAQDVCLVKLLEAHYDAQAILADLGEPPPAEAGLWAVWAAEPPGVALHFDEEADRQGSLRGDKLWCSGPGEVGHALVTLREGERRLLLAVPLRQRGIEIDHSGWQAVGMQRIETARVRFSRCRATRVGEDGQYLSRPGFWHGGAGVAACWFGAASAIAQRLRGDARLSRDPHAAAHLGAIDAGLAAAGALLRELAARIDAQPQSPHERAVMQARSLVQQVADEVIDRVGRALGPGPLCAEGEHARRCADLSVFLRQHHAERDLQALGERCAKESAWRL